MNILPKSQQGFAHILLFLFLLIGLGLAIFLAQKTQIFKSFAGTEPVQFIGNAVANRNGQSVTSSTNLALRVNFPTSRAAQTAPGGKYGIAMNPRGSVDTVAALHLPNPVPDQFTYSWGDAGSRVHSLYTCQNKKSEDGNFCFDLHKNIGPGSGPLLGTIEPQLAAMIQNWAKKTQGSSDSNFYTLENEPDYPEKSEDYIKHFARAYLELYNLVKVKDPAAKMITPGFALTGYDSNNYPLTQKWLTTFTRAFKDQCKLANLGSTPACLANNGYPKFDAINVHVYPAPWADRSCRNDDTNANNQTERLHNIYKAGLEHGKGQIGSFMSFMDNFDPGDGSRPYANSKYWLSEWGWITNYAGPGPHGKKVIMPDGKEKTFSADTEPLNDTCVSQYILDMVRFLENPGTNSGTLRTGTIKVNDKLVEPARPGLTNFVSDGFGNNTFTFSSVKDRFVRVLYFGTNHTGTNGGCWDHVSPDDQKKGWHCWSGWLLENGKPTQPGRMYGCVANHPTDTDRCKFILSDTVKNASGGKFILISEEPTFRDPVVKPYTGDGATISYSLKNKSVGSHTVFVRFIADDYSMVDVPATIRYEAAQAPAPSVAPTPPAPAPSAVSLVYGQELLPADLTANFTVKVAQFVQKLDPGTYRVSGTIKTQCGSVQSDIWSGSTFVKSVPTNTDFTVEQGQAGYVIVRANNCDAPYENLVIKNVSSGAIIPLNIPSTGKLGVAQRIKQVSGPGTYQLTGTMHNNKCGVIQMDVYKGTAFSRNVRKTTESPITVTLASDENAYAIFRAVSCDTRFSAGSLKKAQ